MKNDGMQVFRAMLTAGSNSVENLPTSDDTGSSITRLGGGGGQSVPPHFGGGGGGMNPWESSVETRLTSLDNRLSSIEGGIGDLKVKLAGVESDVKHLPSKEWAVKALLLFLALIAALVTFQGQIQRAIGVSNASDAHPTTEVTRNS